MKKISLVSQDIMAAIEMLDYLADDPKVKVRNIKDEYSYSTEYHFEFEGTDDKFIYYQEIEPWEDYPLGTITRKHDGWEFAISFLMYHDEDGFLTDVEYLGGYPYLEFENKGVLISPSVMKDEIKEIGNLYSSDKESFYKKFRFR